MFNLTAIGARCRADAATARRALGDDRKWPWHFSGPAKTRVVHNPDQSPSRPPQAGSCRKPNRNSGYSADVPRGVGPQVGSQALQKQIFPVYLMSVDAAAVLPGKGDDEVIPADELGSRARLEGRARAQVAYGWSASADTQLRGLSVRSGLAKRSANRRLRSRPR